MRMRIISVEIFKPTNCYCFLDFDCDVRETEGLSHATKERPKEGSVLTGIPS